jgi:hypothetical protein
MNQRTEQGGGISTSAHSFRDEKVTRCQIAEARFKYDYKNDYTILIMICVGDAWRSLVSENVHRPACSAVPPFLGVSA